MSHRTRTRRGSCTVLRELGENMQRAAERRVLQLLRPVLRLRCWSELNEDTKVRARRASDGGVGSSSSIETTTIADDDNTESAVQLAPTGTIPSRIQAPLVCLYAQCLSNAANGNHHHHHRRCSRASQPDCQNRLLSPLTAPT